jgi:DNA-binding beta-propeller fold protein YncE
MGRRRLPVVVPLVLLALAIMAVPAAGGAGPLEPLGAWGTGGQIGPHVESIAATADGSIVVADRMRDRVVVFGYDRLPAGGFEAADPRGIAAVPGGGYLVAEAGRVRRVDPAGTTLATYPVDDPYGVALAGSTVLVADAATGRILRFRLDGPALAPWEAGLVSPRGLAVGPGGRVFVANHGAWRIETFSAGGEHTAGWHVPDPHGVAVDADGVVYVATRHFGSLKWFSTSGERLGAIGAGFVLPRGVAVDCRGTVTVSDNSALRLRAYGDAAAPPPPCVAPAPPASLPPPPASPPPPPAPSPPVEQPELGRTAAATPLSGTVFVEQGDRRRRLTRRTIVPVETLVDTTDGEVELVFETTAGDFQRGVFDSGAFTIHQGRERSLAELRLAGEAPEATSGRALASARRKRRRVWGSASGEFRTSGRHGAATVRGTRWLTEDRADGTFIKVVEGSVLAEAFERDHRRIVRAGESFLARPACASRRNFRIHLRVPVGTRVRSARVIVAGERVRLLPGKRLTAPIDLRGMRQGVVEVRIRVVTATGTVLRETRTYRTCLGARG